MSEPSYKPALHYFALLTACAIFPLIFAGGLVTSKGAGMSVPDWPNSYGYNMFLFPPRLWVGGILYEHSHRLIGAAVGFLAIALAIWAWITERRTWVRWLATALLLAICIQGYLGGQRVVQVRVLYAVIHGFFAQAIFCLAALVSIVTSRTWIDGEDRSRAPDAPRGRRIIRWGQLTIAAIFLQLAIGAVMRHYNAGLAIPDIPLSYGKWLPPMNDDQLAAANAQRIWETGLPPVSMAQIWIHFAHRLGALLVTALIFTLVIKIMLIPQHGRVVQVRRLAILLVFLVIAQVTLGILTVLLRKPADVATAHVAVGALTLVTTFVLTVKAMRHYNPRRPQTRGFEVARRAPRPRSEIKASVM